MRPLHRPMFRYGGPIKEGVMSGIREPHAGGGTIAGGNQIGIRMGNRTGFQNPKSKITTGILSKILPRVGVQKGFLNQPIQGVKNWWQRIKPTYKLQPGQVTPSAGTSQRAADLYKHRMAPFPLKSKINAFRKENPWWTYGGAYAGSPAVVGGLTSIPYKKAGMQALDLAVPDFIFDQDKYFADKEKAKLDEEKKLTANELRIKELEKLLAGKDEPEVPQKTEEEIRNERIQKYRDIMDIKGMNKEAAYDSLIAASQAINESGDFKGDIKSGKLINQVIQAASKQFDKPKKTKDAIDTLILKGEIEKDINQSKGTAAFQAIDALSKASGKSHKYVANQKLGVPNTVGESVAQLKKIKKLPTSDDVATQVYSFSEQSGVPVQKHLTTEQKNEIIGKDKKYASLTELISKEEFTEDGYYIIGTSVIEVIDGVPRIKA